MKTKIIIFSLLTICVFLLLNYSSYAKPLNPSLSVWDCTGENDRELKGWRVMEDRDGDGIYDYETVLNCNGHLDRHPLGNFPGETIDIGDVPELLMPTETNFSYSTTGWDVIVRDSSTSEEKYRVIHTYNPDTTVIVLPPDPIAGVEISYLQGEYPDILEKVILKPNPTSNYVEIIFNSSASYKVQIKMCDSQGNIMYSNTMLVIRDNENKLKIDISDYSDGAYFIKFDADGLSATKQIIKLR